METIFFQSTADTLISVSSCGLSATPDNTVRHRGQSVQVPTGRYRHQPVQTDPDRHMIDLWALSPSGAGAARNPVRKYNGTLTENLAEVPWCFQ